jgi:hypothetical protein
MSSYGPLCTQFYDLDKPLPPADALSYYRSRAEQCGGAVLEPMCGSGRFLLPLQAAGVRIEGSDAAPAMLAACRRHAARVGLSPVLHEWRVQDLALGRRFALAFVPSGSIGLLDAEELRLALARLQAHLLPGAALLLELIDDVGSDAPASELPPRRVALDEQTALTYTCRAEPAAGGRAVRFAGQYQKTRGDTVLASEEETLLLWKHEPRQVLEWLLAAGFQAASLQRPAYASLEPSGCVLVEARVGG